MKLGTLYGVGLGSGDPELMTLKAARILRDTPLISYFSKGGKTGNARAIMAAHITDLHEEMPLVYPVTTEYPVSDPRYTNLIGEFYQQASEKIAGRLQAGEDVAVLCVGDPFFYGSFMHLYRRLVDKFPCEVVAGVPSMAGCWAAAGVPITYGDDVLTVLPATLPEVELLAKLQATDAAVIMKLGKGFAKARRAITQAGMLERATYIEYGTMAAEKILRLQDKADDKAPYFSLIIIAGNGRRI
ncbi:MAG: precorrin-2 C(20)-methyltransferase [Rickettsiales bacterium]|jgi:precorrin-2/cobalt-factor-2 C20-methyltransferase